MSLWKKKVTDLLGETPRRRREPAKMSCESLEGRQLLSQFGQMGLGRRAMSGRTAHVSKFKRLGGLRSMRTAGMNNQMITRGLAAPLTTGTTATPTSTSPATPSVSTSTQPVSLPMMPSDAPQTPPPFLGNQEAPPLAGTPDAAEAQGFGLEGSSQNAVSGATPGGPGFKAPGQQGIRNAFLQGHQSPFGNAQGGPNAQFPSRPSFGPQGGLTPQFSIGSRGGIGQRSRYGARRGGDQGMPPGFVAGGDALNWSDSTSLNLRALPGIVGFANENNRDLLLSAFGDGPGGEGPFGRFSGAQSQGDQMMAFGRPDFGGGSGSPGMPGGMMSARWPGGMTRAQREMFAKPDDLADITDEQRDAITQAREAVRQDLKALMPTESPRAASRETIETYLKDQKAALAGTLDKAEATLTADRQNILISTGLTAEQAAQLDEAIQGLEADQLAIRKGKLTGTDAQAKIQEHVDAILIARGATPEQVTQLNTDLKSLRDALDSVHKDHTSATV